MSMQILTGSMNQFRRDVVLADPTILNAVSDALPLLQGEWLVNGADGYDRIAANTTSDRFASAESNAGTALFGPVGKPVPVFSQRGDTSAQAVGKVPVIENGPNYRAEFTLYKTLSLTLSTAYARGTLLGVAAIDSDSLDPHAGRTILIPISATDQLVVASVETPPASSGAVMVVNVLASPYHYTT